MNYYTLFRAIGIYITYKVPYYIIEYYNQTIRLSTEKITDPKILNGRDHYIELYEFPKGRDIGMISYFTTINNEDLRYRYSDVDDIKGFNTMYPVSLDIGENNFYIKSMGHIILKCRLRVYYYNKLQDYDFNCDLNEYLQNIIIHEEESNRRSILDDEIKNIEQFCKGKHRLHSYLTLLNTENNNYKNMDGLAELFIKIKDYVTSVRNSKMELIINEYKQENSICQQNSLEEIIQSYEEFINNIELNFYDREYYEYYIKYYIQYSHDYKNSKITETLREFILDLMDFIEDFSDNFNHIVKYTHIKKIESRFMRLNSLRERWHQIIEEIENPLTEVTTDKLQKHSNLSKNDKVEELTEKINELLTKIDSYNESNTINDSRLKYLLSLIK
jgi:hypothetical protein